MSSSRPYVLLFLILVLVLFQLLMIPRVTFNWDELQELATLFSMETNYPVQSLRKGLHYLIWPLKYLPFSEDVLMTLARYAAFLTVGLGTYWFVYRIGETLRSKTFGLVAVLMLLSFLSYTETVIQYRTDTFITFAFTASFYLLLKNLRGALPWLAPAVLMGVAMFINPKAVYHVFALAVVFGYCFLAGTNRKDVFWRAFRFGMGSLLLFGILTWLHNLIYQIGTEEAVTQSGYSVKTGFAAVHGASYKLAFIRQAFLFGFVPCICLALGLWHGLKRFLPWWHRINKWAPVWLTAVVLLSTILIHQGTYKYYIINILPTAALLAARPVYGLMLRVQRRRRFGTSTLGPLVPITLIVLGVALVFFFRLPKNVGNETRYQRQTVAILHDIFPQGSVYADGVGLMARGHNVIGLFTAKHYQQINARGENVLRRYFVKDFPGYVLPNIRFPVLAFNPQDQAYLRAWFVPFYGGRLWVHGYRFKAGELQEGRDMELKVDGPYQFTGDLQNLTIDGKPPGTNTSFNAGTYRVACQDCGPVSVVYGQQLPTMIAPEVVMPPGKHSFTLTQPTRLFTNPYGQAPGDRLLIDGKPLPIRDWRYMQAVDLPAGTYTAINQTGREQVLSPFGPLFERYEK